MSMNTENLNRAYVYLEKDCCYYPRNKIIKELNLVCDRINFSKELQDLFLSLKKGDVKNAQTITTLFKKEISEEVFAFLDKLADTGFLWILVGQDGADFIDFAHNNLYQSEEIYFISVVKMSHKMRKLISKKILSVNEKVNARIIFDENPNLVFGFVIQDSTKLLDYSYKTNVIFYLKTYFKNKLEAMR